MSRHLVRGVRPLGSRGERDVLNKTRWWVCSSRLNTAGEPIEDVHTGYCYQDDSVRMHVLFEAYLLYEQVSLMYDAGLFSNIVCLLPYVCMCVCVCGCERAYVRACVCERE